MPRRTDASKPADWIEIAHRYPGFDLDDPDWPALRQEIEGVGRLLETVKARVAQGR